MQAEKKPLVLSVIVEPCGLRSVALAHLANAALRRAAHTASDN